jgi:hypothetical protein
MQDTVWGTKRLARFSTPAIKKLYSATLTVTLEEDWLYSRKIGELNYVMLWAAFSTAQGTYPLRRVWILDSGSTCYVSNDITWLTIRRPAIQGDFLWAGNSKVWIKAYGTAVLSVASSCVKRQLHLKDVAYCSDLLYNLVLFRILCLQGL